MKGINIWLAIGALMAALGVGLGAIGSHTMPDYLAGRHQDPAKIEKRLEQYETGVRYHLLHSLALVAIGLSGMASQRSLVRWSGWFMVTGIVLFSGGIYAIVFRDAPTHMIVPFGGVAFIIGWLFLAAAAWER